MSVSANVNYYRVSLATATAYDLISLLGLTTERITKIMFQMDDGATSLRVGGSAAALVAADPAPGAAAERYFVVQNGAAFSVDLLYVKNPPIFVYHGALSDKVLNVMVWR